ncbi:hypothetical protein BOTNAR_0362g00030 [Botryotinia narcissicola]|uniref:Uncharacterized protein n=1 Tax=Botryotinia narcissicola TaxID=278944 RepID=A0A4Z1HQA2_9HELO|nr:hypothetical protein BOTNAR_0362g00030 [Botryotinia narcissicola]
MCRPANVARYYCDNSADAHRYQPNQWWDGCDHQHNPELRNQNFLESPERRPCRYSLNPPLPDDICPAHRAEYGDADSNTIQRNMSALLERLREAGNYRELATGAPEIREHAYFDVLYYFRWLNPNTNKNERFAEYGDHPQHPRRPRNWGSRTQMNEYYRVLKDLDSTIIRNEVDAEEAGLARPNVMRRLLFQLYRAKIEYQEAWMGLNRLLAPEI